MIIMRKGFTLIELMIVLGVLSILISMGVPQLQAYMERAQDLEYTIAIKESIVLIDEYIKKTSNISQPTQASLQRELYYIPTGPSITGVIGSWEVHTELRDFIYGDTRGIGVLKVLQKGKSSSSIARPLLVYATPNYLSNNWNYYDIPGIPNMNDMVNKVALTYWWKNGKYTSYAGTAKTSGTYYPAGPDYPEGYEISYNQTTPDTFKNIEHICSPGIPRNVYDDSNYGTSIECAYFFNK